MIKNLSHFEKEIKDDIVNKVFKSKKGQTRDDVVRFIHSELKRNEKDMDQVHNIELDLMHITEGVERLTVIQGYMLWKAENKVRRVRRVLKRRQIVLNLMYTSLTRTNCTIEDAFKLAKEEEKRMRGNILDSYKLRSLKSTNLKEFPIMYQVNRALSKLEMNDYDEKYYYEGEDSNDQK